MGETIPMSTECFERLVLVAYVHEEYSLGRCRDLLGWPDEKIREQAALRVKSKPHCIGVGIRRAGAVVVVSIEREGEGWEDIGSERLDANFSTHWTV